MGIETVDRWYRNGPDDFRRGRGNRSPITRKLLAGETVFVSDDVGHEPHRTGLAKLGYRVRQRATEIDGKTGRVYWLEPLQR